MQGETRSHKLDLKSRLKKITCRKGLVKISEVVEKVEVRTESCFNVETTASPLLGNLEVETQLEEEATSSKLISQTLLETKVGRGDTFIGIDSRIRVDKSVTMA